MAEENERPRGGRKKDGAADAARKQKTPGTASARKAATKKEPAKPATSRARRPKVVVAGPTREAIAEHAYLLWERGEPGDETEHWLRAEAELRAA